MNRADATTKIGAEVSSMFDSISVRYDLTNDVLSLGVHRLWRIATVRALNPRPGEIVLDLAAGTGFSSGALAKTGARIIGADFSEGMLNIAREKYRGVPNLSFEWADATELSFADDFFDAATISFGLRNVNNVGKALAEMYRVVKPGGRIVVCEFSQPHRLIERPYAFYNRSVAPYIAWILNNNGDAYDYLADSISIWPAQEQLAQVLQEAGFERVKYRNLAGGIVALHRGFVPPKNSGASKK
ncbi:class I SAM-dependent methyltransferase [Canibacter zhuwentaonis]|uniref:class I SAM-dependent methyltransferase n=1 Tax=Canibacter zhuwentaonis TaxID=2837491 RepID=UPI0032B46F11